MLRQIPQILRKGRRGGGGGANDDQADRNDKRAADMILRVSAGWGFCNCNDAWGV